MASSQARRNAEYLVSATCPDMDELCEEACEQLKSLVAPDLYDSVRGIVTDMDRAMRKAGTYKLREALENTCDELIDAQAKIEQLQDEINHMETAA